MVPDKLQQLAILQEGSLKGAEAVARACPLCLSPLLLHGVWAQF